MRTASAENRKLEAKGDAIPIVNGFSLRTLVWVFVSGLIAGFGCSLGLVASATCRAFCGGG